MESNEAKNVRLLAKALADIIVTTVPEGKIDQLLQDILGLEGVNPVSEHCRLILENDLPPDVCRSFRGIRSWVMCRTWELMEEKKMPFRQAIRTAWAEAKKRCIAKGVPI